MRKMTAAALAAFSSYGWAQQLVAVAPEADPSGFGIIVVVALAAGGLVFLKTKKPEVFDKLLAKIKRKKPQSNAPASKYTVPPIVVERAEPTYNEPTLTSPPVPPPMYSWLVAENEQLRDTNSKLGDQLRAQAATIARLQAQINSYAAAPPAATVQPPIPADFAGFLKA